PISTATRLIEHATPRAASWNGATAVISLLPTPRGIAAPRCLGIVSGMIGCPADTTQIGRRLPTAQATSIPTKTGKDDTDPLTHSLSDLFASVSVSPRTFNSSLRSPRRRPLIFRRHERDQDPLGPGPRRQRRCAHLPLGGDAMGRLASGVPAPTGTPL